MRTKKSQSKQPAEQVVKGIRRRTRRHFSAEDKIRIVLEGLRGDARELIRRSSPLLEFADRRVRLPSFIINLDAVFIRNCLKSDLQGQTPGSQANDGNDAAHSKSLLNDNQKFTIKPDLILRRSADKPPFLIGDLKYKTKPNEDDRYQTLTHILSYQCNKAN